MRSAISLGLALWVAGCGGSTPSPPPTGGGAADGGKGGGGGGGWTAGIVGTSGALLASPDGVHFAMHDAHTQVDLLSLFCTDVDTGWIVGASEWHGLHTGVGVTLRAVAFADRQHGLAVGDGTLLRTVDGGASFTRIDSPAGVALRAVAFARDGAHAWIVGDGATVLRSGDGGLTFSPIAVPAVETLRAVRFAADARMGVAVGDGGRVLVTDDGGETFRAAESAPSDLRGVALTNDGVQIIAVGDHGLIWRSTDGGIRFAAAPSGTAMALSGIGFASATPGEGWVVGAGGTILHTLDFGAHLTPLVSPIVADLTSVEDL